jgi:CHAD domain-containing protein
MAKPATGEFPLLADLDKLVEDLRQHTPKALKEWDAEAIHDARVATRRLKSAMDLLEFVLSDDHRKPFNKVLKKLRRRLGPLRDLDVMLEHLKEFPTDKPQGGAVEWMWKQLESRRDAARKDSEKGEAAADVMAKLGCWWGVREEVGEAREAIDSLLAESLHLQLDAFAERAGRLIDPPAGADRQDPHQLRIAGKAFRYTLEMAEQQGHRLPASVLRTFKQMQECLGLWHDYVVLAECAMDLSLDVHLSYHDAQVQAGILELARTMVRRSSKQLDQFAKMWRRRGQELATVIRQRFPLTRDVSESQTGHDHVDLPDKPVPVALPPDVASTA